MKVEVPFEKNINMQKISAGCYTKDTFKKYVIKLLKFLCNVDDNGKPISFINKLSNLVSKKNNYLNTVKNA